MPEIRRPAVAKLRSQLGCVLWPIGIGLFLYWLAGRFEGLNCFHVAALVGFGLGVLGFRFAIFDRLRRCPHGVRGAISSPPLCAECLAEKKAREHAEKAQRRRRGRERAEAQGADPADA